MIISIIIIFVMTYIIILFKVPFYPGITLPPTLFNNVTIFLISNILSAITIIIVSGLIGILAGGFLNKIFKSHFFYFDDVGLLGVDFQ